MTNEHDDRLPVDPAHPDRPDTLDFARLSSAVSEQDALTEMLGLSVALEADEPSVRYLARGRIEMALMVGAMSGLESRDILLMLYYDAFQLGVGFQKRGGHRPEETGTAGEGSSS